MAAAKVVTDKPAEEAMGESDEAQDQGNVDAFDEGDQARVASQFIAELVESAQTFLRLCHKIGVALEGAESHGIVDVGDGDVVGSQLFAEKHILIAVVTETLIEGVGEHDVSANEEVGGMEVAVGILLALVCRMLMLCCLLIEIAEIALEGVGIATNGYPSIDDIGISHRRIFIDEVGTQEGHVAVDEEQMGVLSRLSQIVADGSSANVFRLPKELTVLPLADCTVLTDDILVCRTVIGHQNLIDQVSSLGLLPKFTHQRLASVIVGRNEDG